MQQRKISSTYYHYDTIKELTETDQRVIHAARNATKNAYAPYSGFYVGAALLMANDTLIEGSNQENASAPVGNCAERVALSAASSDQPGIAVTKLAICSDSGGKKREPVSPCGLCRQTILEYEERFQHPITILLAGEDDSVIVFPSAQELLPLPFIIRHTQS